MTYRTVLSAKFSYKLRGRTDLPAAPATKALWATWFNLTIGTKRKMQIEVETIAPQEVLRTRGWFVSALWSSDLQGHMKIERRVTFQTLKMSISSRIHGMKPQSKKNRGIIHFAGMLGDPPRLNIWQVYSSWSYCWKVLAIPPDQSAICIMNVVLSGKIQTPKAFSQDVTQGPLGQIHAIYWSLPWINAFLTKFETSSFKIHLRKSNWGSTDTDRYLKLFWCKRCRPFSIYICAKRKWLPNQLQGSSNPSV